MGWNDEDEPAPLVDWSKFKIWSTVVNRKTGRVYKYAQASRQAVLSAYAQYEVHDPSLDIQGYWAKYGHLLVETPTEFQCGDFCVLRSKKAQEAAADARKRKKKVRPVPAGQGSLF